MNHLEVMLLREEIKELREKIKRYPTMTLGAEREILRLKEETLEELLNE